jgi:hypothetical protein
MAQADVSSSIKKPGLQKPGFFIGAQSSFDSAPAAVSQHRIKNLDFYLYTIVHISGVTIHSPLSFEDEKGGQKG